jgi:hypothetical protein
MDRFERHEIALVVQIAVLVAVPVARIRASLSTSARSGGFLTGRRGGIDHEKEIDRLGVGRRRR